MLPYISQTIFFLKRLKVLSNFVYYATILHTSSVFIYVVIPIILIVHVSMSLNIYYTFWLFYDSEDFAVQAKCESLKKKFNICLGIHLICMNKQKQTKHWAQVIQYIFYIMRAIKRGKPQEHHT